MTLLNQIDARENRQQEVLNVSRRRILQSAAGLTLGVVLGPGAKQICLC